MDPNTNQPVQSNSQQPAQPAVQQPARQPVITSQPVSGGPKEAPRPIGQSAEWVSPSTPEVNLPKEVSEAGVESRPVVQPIPQVVQQLGVQHAKEATPVNSVKVEPLTIQTPRSVLDHLKTVHKSVKDSFSWLVRLIIKEQDKEKNHPTQSRYE